MKKKIIVSMLVVLALMCFMAISISATTISKDSTVTLNGSFTIGEESVTNPVVNLYDTDGYALVWYLNTDNKLVSDRAVNLITVTDNKAKFNDVSKFYGGTQQKGVVVVNLRDNFVSEGLTGIKTFDTNFQFGYYGANRKPPIQYFYFPVTATEIIDRMFQNTQLIIADIEPGTPISRMGVHAVAQSNLKEFFVPNDITAFIEQDDLGIFQDTKLEKITFEEGSQIKIIPYRCFYMCNNLKELILPNSVEEIHYRAFQLTLFDSNAKLEKLVLGANFKGFKGTTGDNFYIRGAKSLNVYLPASFNADNVDVNTAHQYFTLCPNATFYYCGTEAEWDRLIAKISLGKNGAVGTDSGENIITAKASGKVVFNYNACDAFYNGVHQEEVEDNNPCWLTDCKNCEKGSLYVGNESTHNYKYKASYTNYFANGDKLAICQNANCECGKEYEVVDTVAPIISRIKGYATSDDGKEITFGYDIDTDALAYYNELADTALELGFVVAVNAYLDGAPLANDGTEATLAKGKVVKTVTNAVYSSVDFRLTGKWDNNVTIGDEETQLKYVELFIAGYIFDGTVNYVNNEGSSADYTTVTAVTHTNKPVEA